MDASLTLLKTLLTAKYIADHNLTDKYLEAYITLASKSITRHKGSEKYDENRYTVEMSRMAQLSILKIGAKGQIGHTENGIARVYLDPDAELEVLKSISTILK